MGRYYYVKGRRRGLGIRFYLRSIGAFLIIFGIFSLGYLFFPLISWQLYFNLAFASSNIESPIPSELIVEAGDLKTLVSSGVNSLTRNYTDARNWFDNVGGNASGIQVDSYTISIPNLKINNAKVSTIDYDLSKHLVHYFGTSLPGKEGNAVIFGHSSLPQLFSPSNYMTIFATLHTIRKGDDILVTVNGGQFTYKVFSISITTSSDKSIFNSSSESIITLVTCTPPGTVWKRLIVKARLEELH